MDSPLQGRLYYRTGELHLAVFQVCCTVASVVAGIRLRGEDIGLEWFDTAGNPSSSWP